MRNQITAEANEIIDLALSIALEAHQGQTDRYGRPFILHALRVGLKGSTAEEMVAGFLHDVVEHGHCPFEALERKGVPSSVTLILDALTKREGEDYDAYIDRCLDHPAARRVKLHDLEDNMDFRRVTQAHPEDAERLTKYIRAWHKINNSVEGPRQGIHGFFE